jgi:hypothetical protein
MKNKRLCLSTLWLSLFVVGLLFANSHPTRSQASTIANATSSAWAEAGWLLDLYAQTASEDKPAKEVYKNIQVLKEVPRSQIIPLMNYMRASLGVRCDYCHTLVQFKGFEKDDKPAKITARKHIQMTFDINQANFGGQTVITCNTCHRGQPRPVSVPPIGQGAFRDQIVTDPASIKPAEPLPTAEQLIDKYVQAIGGRASVARLNTRVLKGSYIDWDGTTLPLEVYEKVPNKFISVITLPDGGKAYRSFNGATGWEKNFRGLLREVRVSELARLRRSVDFFREINLKHLYPRMIVTGKEKIGEHEAYVLEATAADNQTEKLYFDTQTSLLLRRYVENETILGPDPEQTDFEDYREVDGMKIPFTIRQSYLDTHVWSTRKFTEIKHNLAIDDAKFTVSESKP